MGIKDFLKADFDRRMAADQSEAVRARILPHARTNPPAEILDLYGKFALDKNLVDKSVTFSVGLSQLGFAFRQAEEEVLGDSAGPQTELLAVLADVRSEHSDGDATSTVYQAACAYARHQTWKGKQLDVLDLPGLVRPARESLRTKTMWLMVSPGADFKKPPKDLPAPTWGPSFDFGYAARCCLVAAS